MKLCLLRIAYSVVREIRVIHTLNAIEIERIQIKHAVITTVIALAGITLLNKSHWTFIETNKKIIKYHLAELFKVFQNYWISFWIFVPNIVSTDLWFLASIESYAWLRAYPVLRCIILRTISAVIRRCAFRTRVWAWGSQRKNMF